MSVLPGLKQ